MELMIFTHGFRPGLRSTIQPFNVVRLRTSTYTYRVFTPAHF
jgi:hypothetical protein